MYNLLDTYSDFISSNGSMSPRKKKSSLFSAELLIPSLPTTFSDEGWLYGGKEGGG